MAGGSHHFKVSEFFIRWLCVFALLTAFYNPTGYSFVDWLLVVNSVYFPVKIFVGFSLAMVILFVYGMALQGLGRRGMMLVGVFFLAGWWALDNEGMLPHNGTVLVVIGEAVLASMITVGMLGDIIRMKSAGHVAQGDDIH
jgi:hypothetical protein